MKIVDKIGFAFALAALFLTVFPVQSPVFSLDFRSGAQTPRPRTLEKNTPTPTPVPSATPTPVPSATPTPVPAVTPTQVPSFTPTPVPVQTLDELRSKIRQRLFAPEVRRGRVGIKIVSLNSGKVVFETDSEKYFMPASNMKNFTVAAALERLGPDFRFVTGVYADALPDSTGTIKGDLRIFGRGDISISTAFFGTSPTDPETYFKGVDRLAERIIAAGVKRIDGSIVGDESYFKGFAIPGTWEWDDLQFYYGAEISALPINDNAVDIAVSPAGLGEPCVAGISPANTIIRVINLCTTTGASIARNLSVVKQIDRNVVEISGTIPVGGLAFKGTVAVTRPSALFVALLKQRLEQKGVAITGGSRVLPANIKAEASQIEITKLESPPLSLIAAKTMKPSQNMYTETLLWTLGEYARARLDVPTVGPDMRAVPDSSQLGISEVKYFLSKIGVPEDGIIQYDGSGLSRHDLVTPAAVVTLYTYMATLSPYKQAWRDSLTIGGVDGTLARRFTGTAAAGNFRGKTGTIDQVSALSGYMTTAAGEQLVVSILINGVAQTRTRVSLADDIVIALANFNGKID